MKQQNEKVAHKKYGKVKVLTRTATDRGGLARIETSTQGTFWVRAAEVGPAMKRATTRAKRERKSTSTRRRDGTAPLKHNEWRSTNESNLSANGR